MSPRPSSTVTTSSMHPPPRVSPSYILTLHSNSTVPDQLGGVFWAIMNRLLIIFQVTILIMSEVGWPAVFFDRFFPVLGAGFGLGALGIFQGL